MSTALSPLSILKFEWFDYSKNYKFILSYLSKLSKDHNFVFPCYKRMSEVGKMSLRTAKTIVKYFKSKGFVGWIRRPYNSNLYFLHEELIAFDFDHADDLLKKDKSCTQSCTVLTITESCSCVHCGKPSVSPAAAPQNVPIDFIKEHPEQLPPQEQNSYTSWCASGLLPIPLRIQFMHHFNFEKMGWLVQKLSEQSISEILSNMKWFVNKQKVGSLCGLFVKLSLKQLGYA